MTNEKAKPVLPERGSAHAEPSKVISYRITFRQHNHFAEYGAFMRDQKRIEECVDALRRHLVGMHASGHAVLDCGLVIEKE